MFSQTNFQTPKVEIVEQRIAQIKNKILKHCCYYSKNQSRFDTLLKCQFSFLNCFDLVA